MVSGKTTNCKKIRHVVVCTTTHRSDNQLAKFLESKNVKTFRGSEKDILMRFLDAAKHFDTDFIIAIDGDDVYADPSYVDKIVSEFKKIESDYIQITGVPIGLTPFGIKTSALQQVCNLKTTKNTETGYIRFFTETHLFKVQNVNSHLKIKFPKDLRLSLDYQEDFELAQEIFRTLGNNFHINDVLKLLKKEPRLLKIINGLEAKWNKHWNMNLANLPTRNI